VWLHLLISENRKTVVETTISAVTRCLFQILPARDDTGTPAEIFDEALAIVSKVVGLWRRSSQMALYTAAREYFESVPIVREGEASPSTSPSTASGHPGVRENQNRGATISIAEGVETFSTSVVTEILTEASIEGDNESLRQARISMVLAFVRQPPAADITRATRAARGKITTALKGWRAIERSRTLQKDIDEALEANQQTLARAE
jgi:hypothetical protein